MSRTVRLPSRRWDTGADRSAAERMRFMEAFQLERSRQLESSRRPARIAFWQAKCEFTVFPVDMQKQKRRRRQPCCDPLIFVIAGLVISTSSVKTDLCPRLTDQSAARSLSRSAGGGPMPRPFMTAEWVNLGIITYAVPPDLLAGYVPDGVELD